MDPGTAPATDEPWPDRPASIGMDWQGDSLILELPRPFRWRLTYGLLAVLVAPLAGGIPKEAGELVLFALIWLGIGFWVVLGLTRRQIRLDANAMVLSLHPPWGGEQTRAIEGSELQAISIEPARSGWPFPCTGLALILLSTEGEESFGHGLWKQELEWLQSCLLDWVRKPGPATVHWHVRP